MSATVVHANFFCETVPNTSSGMRVREKLKIQRRRKRTGVPALSTGRPRLVSIAYLRRQSSWSSRGVTVVIVAVGKDELKTRHAALPNKCAASSGLGCFRSIRPEARTKTPNC